MLKFILLFFTTFLLSLPTTATFTAIVYNNCGVSMDVKFHKAGQDCGSTTIAAGGNAKSPCEPNACPEVAAGAVDNCGGATILISESGGSATLAAEYGNRQNDKGERVMWYNFSMDNGSPFKDKSRKLIGGAGCPEIDCTPGTDDCNYKVRNPSIESCDPDPYYIQVAIC